MLGDWANQRAGSCSDELWRWPMCDWEMRDLNDWESAASVGCDHRQACCHCLQISLDSDLHRSNVAEADNVVGQLDSTGFNDSVEGAANLLYQFSDITVIDDYIIGPLPLLVKRQL